MLSRSDLTLASCLLLVSTPGISPADAVKDVRQLYGLCPSDIGEEQRRTLIAAACILLKEDPGFLPKTPWPTPYSFGNSPANTVSVLTR